MTFEIDGELIGRLRDDIAALADPGVGGGPRPVGSSGHRAAQALLAAALANAGTAPAFGGRYDHAYGGSFANLVGRIAAAGMRRRTVLVGAHYDTVPATPGADDNASGVAIALEVARAVHAAPLPDADLVIALFDAEEPPHFLGRSMGSIRFFEDVLRPAAELPIPIVLDICGHALRGPLVDRLDLASAIAVVGLETEPALRAAFDAVAGTVGDRKLQPLPLPHAAIGGDVSDYHVFRTNDLPYLFLSCGEGPTYHQPSDTIARLDIVKIAATARYVERLARAIAAVPAAGTERPDPTHADATIATRGGRTLPAGGRTLPGGGRTLPDDGPTSTPTWSWFAERLAPRLHASWRSAEAMLADLRRLSRHVRYGGGDGR